MRKSKFHKRKNTRTSYKHTLFCSVPFWSLCTFSKFSLRRLGFLQIFFTSYLFSLVYFFHPSINNGKADHKHSKMAFTHFLYTSIFLTSPHSVCYLNTFFHVGCRKEEKKKIPKIFIISIVVQLWTICVNIYIFDYVMIYRLHSVTANTIWIPCDVPVEISWNIFWWVSA